MSGERVVARDVVRLGTLAGLIATFSAAIGMVEVFDTRSVIDPWLSLGYLALLWPAAYYGYRVSHRPVLEGVAPTPPGVGNVVAGAGVGAIAGLFVAAFMVLVDTFDVRDIFINIHDRMLDILGFGQDVAVGAILQIVVCAAIGAASGALHLVAPRVRALVLRAFTWIVLLGFTELVLGNVLQRTSLHAVDDFLYSSNRGVTWPAAIVVAVLVIAGGVVFRGRGEAARARFQALPEPRRRRAGFAIAGTFVAIGMLVPSYFGPFLNEILATVGLFMLMGLGLNIVVGFAGLLDLGYIAFFAVGAYAAAVLTSASSPQFAPELAFFAAVPFVILIAAIAGIIVGTPVIRMRGDYLAIVTLAFGEIARLIFQADWLKGVFGGAQGIKVSPTSIRTMFGYVLVAVGVIVLASGVLRWLAARAIETGAERDPRRTAAAIMAVLGAVAIGVGIAFPDFATWNVRGIDVEQIFRIVLVFVVLAAFISWRLEDSRVGRAWMAMREDEHVAQAMGINVVTAKLLAFVTGAVLASFGGALFAIKIGSIFPSSFKIVQSIIILVVVIVGGMGSLRGVAIGALVLIGILGGPTQPGLLREFEAFKLLIYGVLLVVMMLKRPEGLLPSARRSRELHQDEFLQDAWIRKTADDLEQAAEEQA